MWTKGKKTSLILSIALVAGALGYLALGNFGENLVYFVTPSEVRAFSAEQSQQKIRVAGMVVKKSIKTQADPVGLTFELTDGEATIPVVFQGIPPDLFKEGRGIVAQGRLGADGMFVASEVLAKHDENYMPPEAAEALEKAGHPVGAPAEFLKEGTVLRSGDQ